MVNFADAMVDPLAIPEPERNGFRLSFAVSPSLLAFQDATLPSLAFKAAGRVFLLLPLPGVSKALPWELQRPHRGSYRLCRWPLEQRCGSPLCRWRTS